MTNILIYGYYGHFNLGDSLFIPAFKHLFPHYTFKFVDHLTIADIKQADAIFVGGGSMMLAPISAEHHALQLLETKPLFYLGVGIEKTVPPANPLHPHHQKLLPLAKVVAVRNADGYDIAAALNPNTYLIPDLVYALANETRTFTRTPMSVLVLPNAEVLPDNSSLHWKHAAHTYWRSEFSQFLSRLHEDGYNIDFAAMCQNYSMDDTAIIYDLITQMPKRDYTRQVVLPDNFTHLTELISNYELVISQRYHGCILADIVKTPVITIAHHDKLKTANNSAIISYYQCSKAALLAAVDEAKTLQRIGINPNVFDSIRLEVIKHLE